jgi:hypothetical protein
MVAEAKNYPKEYALEQLRCDTSALDLRTWNLKGGFDDDWQPEGIDLKACLQAWWALKDKDHGWSGPAFGNTGHTGHVLQFWEVNGGTFDELSV